MLAFMFFGLEITLGAIILGAAATAGTMMLQRQQVKKQASKSRKSQQAAAEEQAKAIGRQRAVQQAPITAKQMKLVMGQTEIQNLTDKFSEEDQVRIFTLPTLPKTSPIDRINQAISDLVG